MEMRRIRRDIATSLGLETKHIWGHGDPVQYYEILKNVFFTTSFGHGPGHCDVVIPQVRERSSFRISFK